MVDNLVLSVILAFVQVLYVRSQCGGTPQALTVNLLETYTLETPGFPGGYSPSLTCVWTADVSSNSYALLLQVVKSDLGCPGDGITVVDDLSGTKKLDKYCDSGEASSIIFTIESGKVRITFASDANSISSEKGLQVLMYTVPKSNDATCLTSTTLQAKASQDTFFLSPNFPVSYPNNVDCAWNIEAPSGYTTRLILNFEDIESDPTCQYDYIEVKTNSKVFTKTCEEWSFSKTSSTTFESNETITVVLKSDDETTKRGFMFIYRAIEDEQMTTTTTTSTAATTTTSTLSETTTPTSSDDTSGTSTNTVVPLNGNSENDIKDEKSESIIIAIVVTLITICLVITIVTAIIVVNKQKNYTTIADAATSDPSTLKYELFSSSIAATSQTSTMKIIDTTDKNIPTTVDSNQITTTASQITSLPDQETTEKDGEVKSSFASTATIGFSVKVDKTATDKDKIVRTTIPIESNNITKFSKVKSDGTTDTLTFRGEKDAGCSLTGCVVPLVLAISLLLGTLFLCLVILGSTRWRKRTRKYEITPRIKTNPCKTQAVLPSVKELSDEECSL